MPNMLPTSRKPTPAMVEYMEKLFIEKGFSYTQKRIWIKNKFNKYMDELNFDEVSYTIEYLLDLE